MTAEHTQQRDAFGPLRAMPPRDDVRTRPETNDPAPGPGSVPWAQFAAAGPGARPVSDSCVNFTLPGGGAVLMTVPTALSTADACFAATVINEFLTSLAARMKQ